MFELNIVPQILHKELAWQCKQYSRPTNKRASLRVSSILYSYHEPMRTQGFRHDALVTNIRLYETEVWNINKS